MKWIMLISILILAFYSCSESPTKSDDYEVLISLKDYEFVNNRYFFIDNYCRDRYESAYSEDLSLFTYEVGMNIVDLEVWISTDKYNDQAVQGAAVLDPNDPVWQEYENYYEIDDEMGKAESGYFRLLPWDNYDYDPYRGFFWLSQSIPSNQSLAIAYRLDDGQKVGSINDTTGNVLLKLIKPINQQQRDYPDTWPLVMRNVYSVGDTLNSYDDFNIEIEHRITRLRNDSEWNSYLSLLGLDIIDEYSNLIENGDGQFDNNPYFFDRNNGVLIFPGLQPFDPLPGSRFQLQDEDRVEMYWATDFTEMARQSKFQISFLSKN